jgi:hypothetical protein
MNATALRLPLRPHTIGSYVREVVDARGQRNVRASAHTPLDLDGLFAEISSFTIGAPRARDLCQIVQRLGNVNGPVS